MTTTITLTPTRADLLKAAYVVGAGVVLLALVAHGKAPDEQSQGLDRVAKRVLRKGMTTKEVRRRFGRPESRDSYCNRAEVWTYVTSTSGTWAYVVAFVDAKLVMFGEANPQWFGDDDYPYEGEASLRPIVRAARTGECDAVKRRPARQ